MPTLIEKIKPVVLGKLEFEIREKLKLKCFLWNFWAFRILTEEKNNIVLVIEHSSTGAVFSVDILMDETELVVAQN